METPRGSHRERVAVIGSGVAIIFVVIAGFVFTVSTTSLGYSPVAVVTTSEKTFQTTSMTTLEHVEIRVTTSGNYTHTSTISTGYNYITNTYNVSTPTTITVTSTRTTTKTCSVPFWSWLFGGHSTC